METRIELSVSISERKLSDGSSAWSVLMRADGQAIEIECIDYRAACLLRTEISRAVENYTNLTGIRK